MWPAEVPGGRAEPSVAATCRSGGSPNSQAVFLGEPRLKAGSGGPCAVLLKDC